MIKPSKSSMSERLKLSFKLLMYLMMRSALEEEMKLHHVWIQKSRASLRCPAHTLPPAEEPVPHPALLLLTRRSLLALHQPCERLAKAIHQMFSRWKLPAFHRSFGFHTAPSVQGLFSNAAAPFRPITSTWTHFSRAFPAPIGSFDSLHSLYPFQDFLNCLRGFFSSAWTKM